ncbi:McrB family protein [Nostoc sp. PA-18-2419]|uniref:McrB family protein n=1 Tax=Nostoc sp. PA-18-2419 TaxID=2575443 RepID=UPI001CB9B957|nr:AAA family ATPase [Nostoc sp. PA-18-2419]
MDMLPDRKITEINLRFNKLGWDKEQREECCRARYGESHLTSLSNEELVDLLCLLNNSNQILENKLDVVMKSPIQKILFGCPGTGKSYKIEHTIIPGLGIKNTSSNVIKTVFHPEYTYGDFMGKLVPITKDRRVEYNFHPGHFLRALVQAYKNLITAYDKQKNEINNPQNVVLVIDEINRGNSSAIFGTVFQLLDREIKAEFKGWSSYSISLTEIEFNQFSSMIGIKDYDNKNKYELNPLTDPVLLKTFEEKIKFLNIDIKTMKIKIPSNLSIVATMNTSDNSIYFMDNAFKRRWEWEYVDWDEDGFTIPKANYGNPNGCLSWNVEWKRLVKNLNQFIKDNHNSIRGGRIEDMQIGYRFINTDPEPVTESQIQNKLMFFVWDSIFNRDKKPLRQLLKLNEQQPLVTFGDFIRYHNQFVSNLLNYQ